MKFYIKRGEVACAKLFTCNLPYVSIISCDIYIMSSDKEFRIESQVVNVCIQD